jgi:hypothetical protein
MRNRLQSCQLAALLSLGLSGLSILQAGTLISVQFQGSNGPINFQGVEPDAAAADASFANSSQWNHLVADGSTTTFPNLLTSTGANSGVSLSVDPFSGYNDGSHNLPDTYFYQLAFSGSSFPFTISGLDPNQTFTLFLYGFNSVHSANDRGEIFTVGSSTFTTATGHASSLDPTHAVDGFITGVTSANGTVSGAWAFDPLNRANEIDWSGFQLDVSSAVATPEPGTLVLLAGGLGLLIRVRARSRLPRSPANKATTANR